jgi:formylglycine-generating enzyme required for sulfatase activity
LTTASDERSENGPFSAVGSASASPRVFGNPRRRAAFSELPPEAAQLVLKLADQRLLVTNQAPSRSEQTVEVAHEALISNWGTLRAWVNEDREFLLWRERLGTLLTEWERAQESDDALLRGPFLIEAQKWFDQRSQDLSTQEQRFISSSRLLSEQKEKEQKEAIRKLRRGAWMLAGLGVLAVIFGVIAGVMARRSETFRRLAEQRALGAEEQARIAQERARIAALQVTKEHPWLNSLGMKFVPVNGTEVLFSIWDTRVQDFEAFAAQTGYHAGDDRWKSPQFYKNKGFKQSPVDPVVEVSWTDAMEFCAWLTKTEIALGRLPKGMLYRLPTDQEWSNAVGLSQEVGSTPAEKSEKIKGFPWGDEWPPPEAAGNYCGAEGGILDRPTIDGYRDDYIYTSPVGSFRVNQFGLFDMGGNVWQWCQDWLNADHVGRVLRGACFNNGPPPAILYASFRFYGYPGEREEYIGFRCVVARESSR